MILLPDCFYFISELRLVTHTHLLLLITHCSFFHILKSSPHPAQTLTRILLFTLTTHRHSACTRNQECCVNTHTLWYSHTQTSLLVKCLVIVFYILLYNKHHFGYTTSCTSETNPSN